MSDKSISLSSTRTATRMLSYFFRRGQKESMENLLRQLIYRRATGKIAVSTPNLFKSFFLSATPFVGLKTRRRRRGKRLIAKIAILERDRGERSSFVALANTLQLSGASSKPFIERLERELESLANTERKSGLREKRDESHKLAYTSRPYRWRRRSRPQIRRRRKVYLYF